jgi:TPR repeat protein
MGKYEVTFAEWDACVRDGGCNNYRPGDAAWGRGNRPVINVSWDDAKQYVGWLSRGTGRDYRLPSEAEWEYAARAGTTTERYWGEDANRACGYGNVYDRTSKSTRSGARTSCTPPMPWCAHHDCLDGYAKTAPVGSFRANDFGLHDVLGNVYEWVEDCGHLGYKGAPTDSSAWTTGDCNSRVLRGGSWNSPPSVLRTSWRHGGNPVYRGNEGGFRIARTVRQEEEPKPAEETETALAVSPPARPPTAHQCDRLAANPSDPRRVGEGVAIEDISPDSAIAACRSAVGEFPKNPRFQYQLGRALQKGERDEDAIAWYRMAVAQGYAPAQNNLGRMYANGRGVAQDDHEAVRWYREAAAQGYAPAQNSLGFMYVKVRGVAQDDHQAVRWFRKAAEQGNANGQNNLGFMYSKGRGVEKDENLAVAWYRKAAEQGDKLAQKNLGWMYQKGRGVAQDNHEAVRWFRKAAEQGYARGQASLGFMYEKGLGVEKDENLAVEWYRKAAEQGDKLAQKNLRNLSQRSR